MATTFTPATNFPAGFGPRSIAVADVNGDGKLDMVVADYEGGVSVLLGNGSGGFGAPTSYPAGPRPISVSVADVNGDGKPDLLVADRSAGVSVLLGNASGGFSAATSFAAGQTPYSMTVADVNRDGKLDLVVGGYSGTISVLLGDGNGGFGAPSSYVAGQGAISVTVADVNADGKPDLVVADRAGGLSVLLGNGSGTFGTATTYGAPNPLSVTVADVNRDGKPDLVAASASGVSVLLGNGRGGFGTATTYAAGPTPISVTVADVTGDGKPDLLVADYNGGVSELVGDGTGAFGTPISYAAGTNPYSVAVADVNGDGRPDLMVAAFRSGASVLLNASLTTVTSISATASRAGALQAGDTVTFKVNTAGAVDVVTGTPILTLSDGGTASYTGGSGTAALSFLYTVGNADAPSSNLTVTGLTLNGGTITTPATLGFATAASFAPALNPASATVADVNADGKPDLIVPDRSGGVSVLLGNGSGGFGAATSFAAGTVPYSATVADVNRDGKPDLIVANYYGNVSVLLGNGSGGFGAATNYAAGPLPSSVTAADVNGDGKPDLVVADYYGGVSVLLGDGSGGFGTPVTYASGLNARSSSVADVNGDGKLDIVIPDSHGVSVLLGNGNGTFGTATTFAAGPKPISAAIADVNADGKPDLVVADGSGGVSVLLGNGNGTFGAATAYTAGSGPRSVTVADVNRDGKLDIVVAAYNGGVSVLLGNGDGSFGTATSFAAGPNPNSVTVADVNGDGSPDLVIADYQGGVSVLLNSSTMSATFDTNSVSTAPGAATGLQVVCFAAGTLIRTERGEVAVEALTVGDLVLTASGVHRPVKWLGHRVVDCARHPDPAAVMPVRIDAGAFGPGLPEHDLWVSPGHAVCAPGDHGVLIPAHALCNGATVQQIEVPRVTYWHVELDSHDILLANGLPAESYMDVGNRRFFAEADAVDLHAGPDGVAGSLADYCRPFVEAGPLVEAARNHLRVRAAALGWVQATAPLGGAHLMVGGCQVDPVVDGATLRFTLPRDAGLVWLVSDAVSPHDVAASGDLRQLGLNIRAIGIAGAGEMALDDPLLCAGWHGLEDAGNTPHRWTSGRALLPAALWQDYAGPMTLRIDLAGPSVAGWQAPSLASAEQVQAA